MFGSFHSLLLIDKHKIEAAVLTLKLFHVVQASVACVCTSCFDCTRDWGGYRSKRKQFIKRSHKCSSLFDVVEYFLSPFTNWACIAPRCKTINVKSNISWQWEVVESAITIMFLTILTLTILRFP